jgi:hypothetical protein
MWRPSIDVDANYDIPDSTAELTILGNEYFKDVKVTGDTTMEFIDTRTHKFDVPTEFIAEWIRISGTESVSQVIEDSVLVDSISFNWTLYSDKPYFRNTFTIKTDTADISEPESSLPFTHDKNRIVYKWYGFMGDSIQVTGSFKCDPNASIIRDLSTRYTQLPVDLKVESELASVRYRTTIEYSDTLTLDLNVVAMKDK